MRDPNCRLPSIALAACTSLALASSVGAQSLCPDRPNVLLFLMDDYGWSSLPFLNPPIQWRAGERSTGPGKFRGRQSPTFNRLDARMCAAEDGTVDLCPVALRAEEAEALGLPVSLPDWQAAEPPEPGVSAYQSCEALGTCVSPVAASDHLPFFGGLRRLAERGTVFTHFYAASAKCLPSRAALLTGKHGNCTGSTDNGYANRVPRDADSFVRRLRQEAGYYTGLIGKWHATGEPSRGQFFRFGGPDLEALQRNKDTCKDGFDEAIWYDRAERGYYCGPGMDCACARSTCNPAGPTSCSCSAIGSPSEDASPWAIWGDQESHFYLAGSLRSRGRLTHNDSSCSDATPPAHKAGLGQGTRFGCPFSPRVYADLAKDFLSRNGRGTCSTDPGRACLSDSECTPGACVPPARPFFLMLSFTSVHDGHRRRRERVPTMELRAFPTVAPRRHTSRSWRRPTLPSARSSPSWKRSGSTTRRW